MCHEWRSIQFDYEYLTKSAPVWSGKIAAYRLFLETKGDMERRGGRGRGEGGIHSLCSHELSEWAVTCRNSLYSKSLNCHCSTHVGRRKGRFILMDDGQCMGPSKISKGGGRRSKRGEFIQAEQVESLQSPKSHVTLCLNNISRLSALPLDRSRLSHEGNHVETLVPLPFPVKSGKQEWLGWT